MRGLLKTGVLSALAVALISCQSSSIGDGLQRPSADVGLSSTPTLAQNPEGEVIGTGAVRVALLIPKTAPGNASVAANQLYNGSLLAMQDFGGERIQLVIKDTKGTAADAQAMANQAMQEGASAVIGPLFSSSVNAASAVTQPAGKPIIGFSTDTSVARRGVYLISYTPQADTSRMIDYALSQGKRSIHAFIPNNAEGKLREAMLKQIAGAAGIKVNTTPFEFSGPGIETAARSAAISIQSADSIYIPEGGQIPGVILSSLKRSGADITGKQILGSGKWESVKFGDPALNGAWYTGRDITKFNGFATRYKGRFQSDANVLSALGYDAVTLAITLVAKDAQNAFSSTNLEARSGFQGVNGILRLKSDGTAQRGLAIYTVQGGSGTLLQAAPTRFGS